QLLNRHEFNGLCDAWIITRRRCRNAWGNSWYMGCGIGSWHRFDQRKANSKVPRRHRRPGIGPGLCTTRTGRRSETVEEEAPRTGLSLGMTLIDPAELYGDGRSEKRSCRTA